MSCHIHLKERGKEVLEHMGREMRKGCLEHKPLWTLIGVERLAEESMRVGLEFVAYDRT